MSKQQVGVIGMAVMGKNLALNIESRGYSVSLYNRTSSKTTAVIEEKIRDKNLVATATGAGRIYSNALEKPEQKIFADGPGR
ncbi:MAG: NAD(P)-binding domain-containing protein [Alkalibacterium sp.]|nr:NAD(P)-binding domain-containing protein [Alkalibacterium sp.]